MSNVIELASVRERMSPAFAWKQRNAIFNRIIDEEDGRDYTEAEQRRVRELENAVAFGKARTTEDAHAQSALAAEIMTLIEDPPFKPEDLERCYKAHTSAEAFFHQGG
jgi:hypothetical protein